jgi:glycosyltransferase involved in cell wall biosynthesis
MRGLWVLSLRNNFSDGHQNPQLDLVAAGEPRSKPIRAVHLLHTMAYGGVETAILNWCRTFDRGRVLPHLLCFANPGRTEQPFVAAATEAGFDVTRIPWGRGKPVRKAAKTVADYLQANGIEILHCHNTYANVVGLLASKRYPVKTVTTMYVWGKFGFKRGILQSIDSFAMKRFDKVTAHCETCFRDTVARGIPPGQLDLLICGYPAKAVDLEPEERQRRRRLFGASPDDVVLIYMARFWPEKAHDNLLEAFEILRRKHPEVRLWLPGLGPELEKIRALCTEKRLDDWVKFLGFQNDPDSLLALADIQVHPSDNEGVALSICAGMNAGLPIVASRVGGLPEILRDGENALLIPPRSPQAFVDAVSDLISNPKKACGLGRAAQRFIEEQYSLQEATRKVEAVYTRLAQRHP